MKYLTRIQPANNRQLWGDFDAFFNAPSPFMPSLFEWNNGASRPAVDLFEDDSDYIVQAEVPGFDRKEITVELEKDRLILKGSRKVNGDDEKTEVSFHRSITIPDSVKADKVKAKYENGILTVTVPKAEAQKPIKIEVKS
jgi:HSP20 family protein